MSSGESTGAERALQVLVVGPDPVLADEIDDALMSASAARSVLRSAPDFEAGLEQIRSRPADLVLVELGHDPQALRQLAARIHSLAPEAVLAGIQRPSDHDDDKVLIEALRARFEDVLQRPVSSQALRPLLERLLAAQRADNLDEGVVIAFHSTKGGVGKSSLSVNTSVALAQRYPDRVLLIDASLQLGVCSVALDLDADATIADAARERDRLDETLLRQLAPAHESGLRVLAAPRDAVEAAEVDEESMARLLSLARRTFDFVIVDTLPILDGVMLAVLDLADRLYLVNQGTVPDVIGAARLLEVLDDMGIGIARRRVVLNRNVPRFPGALGASQVSERLKQAVDHEIPYEKRVFTGLNLGEPHVLKASTRFGWGKAIAALADEIAELRSVSPAERRSRLES